MSIDLLRHVRMLDPLTDTDQVVDVLIREGQVAAIRAPHGQGSASSLETLPPDLSPDAVQVYDSLGLVLLPGLVDLYSYTSDPGFEAREPLPSLLQSAIAGGFTRLTLLPNTAPPLDHPGGIEQLRSRLRTFPQAPLVNYWGAITQGAAGENLTELADLVAAGVVGFTDGRPLQNWNLVRRLLEYGQGLGKPIALQMGDRALSGGGVARDGIWAMRLGLPGSPAMAEAAPLAALLECVATIGTPVHLLRISTARSVALIREARARGLPITASVSWMHLLLNTTHLQSYDPSLRLDPPLGNPADQTALIEGIQTGVIDAIAIDHRPYTYEEKTVPFAEAPPGAIGLQLALPLLWDALVTPGHLSALDLCRCLSTRPAQILGQTPPAPPPPPPPPRPPPAPPPPPPPPPPRPRRGGAGRSGSMSIPTTTNDVHCNHHPNPNAPNT
ncbi:MAG: dihydroorotase, partial [Synechococcales bacterium]|nr:dihydroorotase [Synechococcales bacterium]